MENKKHKINNRDVRLDGLRVIGLFAIILAHVFPPPLLYQIRNFDVPLMVLVSGASYALSSGVMKGYGKYVWGRVRRLIIPTWVFLTVYLGILYLIDLSGGRAFPHTMEAIIKSYTLVSGIGYVWIIRVFMLVALAVPLLTALYKKLGTGRNYLLSIGTIYILYELFYLIYSKSNISTSHAVIEFILQNIIFDILSFGCVAGLGIYLIKAKNKNIIWLLLGFLAIFVSIIFLNGPQFIPTQGFKYPPRVYYLSYALFASLSLYLIGGTDLFKKLFRTKLMLFISSSSLWIYLWHILFLYLTDNKIRGYFPHFLVVASFAILAAYIQKRLFIKISNNLTERPVLRSWVNDVFLK